MALSFSTLFSRLAPRYGPHFGIATQGFSRGLGLVFVLSFWSFASQAGALSGSHGLVPVASNVVLLSVCGIGVLAGLGMLYGLLPWFGCLTAICCHGLLLQGAGGWLQGPGDTLLLEMAIPALLLIPPLRRTYPPLAECSSRLTGLIWLNLILCKLLLGSGIAQLLSADTSWADSTALYHFFETQPLPVVTGWYFHQLPATVLEYGVWGLIFIEIMLPAYVLLPRTFRNILAGGTSLIAVLLMAGGHHGFLPLEMLLLALTLVDDVSWRVILPAHWGPGAATTIYRPPVVSKVLVAFLFALVLIQAFPTPRLPGEHALNSLNLSNRYALFQTVPKQRFELSLQGSLDGRQWIEYRFKVKPTDPRSLPPISLLHHPRLDAQFVSLARQVGTASTPNAVPPPVWLVPLMNRLFSGDPGIQTLFPVNPFPTEPPRFLRLVVYEYQFADPVARREQHVWWIRDPLGMYGPVFRRGGGLDPKSPPPVSD